MSFFETVCSLKIMSIFVLDHHEINWLGPDKNYYIYLLFTSVHKLKLRVSLRLYLYSLSKSFCEPLSVKETYKAKQESIWKLGKSMAVWIKKRPAVFTFRCFRHGRIYLFFESNTNYQIFVVTDGKSHMPKMIWSLVLLLMSGGFGKSHFDC